MYELYSKFLLLYFEATRMLYSLWISRTSTPDSGIIGK